MLFNKVFLMYSKRLRRIFTGRVAAIDPCQNYGIVEIISEDQDLNGMRVPFSLSDQGEFTKEMKIDGSKKRITSIKERSIIKFLLDKLNNYERVYLWAQPPKPVEEEHVETSRERPEWKKPKDMAHNYPRYGRYGNSPSEVEMTVHQKEKSISETTQRPAPDSSSVQPGIKKEAPEVPRDIQQETAVVVQPERPVRSQPWFEVGRNDSNHSNNGPNRKVDGTRKPQGKKRHNGPNCSIYGRDFRYLERDVGATPIPGKASQKSVPKVPDVPKETQAVQNDPLQVKKTDSVPSSPKVRQESEKGFVMPSWVADEGVNLVKNGGKVHLGIVGG